MMEVQIASYEDEKRDAERRFRERYSAEFAEFAKHAMLNGTLRRIFDGMRSYEDAGTKPRQKKRVFRELMKAAQKELRLADKALETWLERGPNSTNGEEP
jgi:hypothetical protein